MHVPYASRLSWLLGERTRMMYFIHVPKCGGKFVESIFRPFTADCPVSTETWAAGHQTYAEYRNGFKAHGMNFDKGYTFAVVRNPWDWHVSWYHYIKGDAGGADSGHVIEAELFQSMSFENYIDWLSDETAPQSPQGYIRRQLSDWIVGAEGTIAVNRVLRQEHLADDIRAMVKALRLEVDIRDAKVNVSSRAEYRRYYNDRTAQLVAARHQRDIAMFGYSF